MTLEALASSSLPAFVVYNTISASSSQNFLNDSMRSMAFEGSNLVQDSSKNEGGVACVGHVRRKRRRRERNCKNKEEAENQRMTHIAVERNRRRLMNEHLTVLRSLMPESYIQRDSSKNEGGVACVGHVRRKRRRRERNCKNKEEAENQRMTHIAVERNRRRLMNEHLTVLRSLMPESYIQRGDQASVVGGAIDFVKELEHHLQSLEVQKRAMHQQKKESSSNATNNHEFERPPPFYQFFAFPQYTLCHTQPDGPSPTSIGDIEVTLIETHANLRILTHRRPRQLLKMAAGLQTLGLSILHLNVTSVEALVLYSISVKVEEGCNLTTVDDIAAALHHLLTLLAVEAATSPIVQ